MPLGDAFQAPTPLPHATFAASILSFENFVIPRSIEPNDSTKTE